MGIKIPFSSGGGFEIGEVVETAATTKGGLVLLALDGSTYLNSAFPILAGLLDAGDYQHWVPTGITANSYSDINTSGDNVIAITGASTSVQISTDKGVSYNAVASGSTANQIACAVEGGIYLCSGGGSSTTPRIYRSTNGTSFSQVHTKTTGATATWNALTIDGTVAVTAGRGQAGAAFSTDTGATWTDSTASIQAVAGGIWIDIDNVGANVVAVSNDTGSKVAISSDSGQNWVAPTTNPLNVSNICTAVAMSGTTVYIANDLGEIAKSTNSGVDFTLLTGLPIGAGSAAASTMSFDGTVLMVGTDTPDLYTTTDDFATFDVTSQSPLTTITRCSIESDYSVIAGASTVRRTPKTVTSFTLPNVAGNGNIRDRIGADT